MKNTFVNNVTLICIPSTSTWTWVPPLSLYNQYQKYELLNLYNNNSSNNNNNDDDDDDDFQIMLCDMSEKYLCE